MITALYTIAHNLETKTTFNFYAAPFWVLSRVLNPCLFEQVRNMVRYVHFTKFALRVLVVMVSMHGNVICPNYLKYSLLKLVCVAVSITL